MRRLNQAAETPFSVLYSLRATGLIPTARMQQLDPSGQKYYFQRDAGKICLTRYTPRPDPNTPKQQIQRAKLSAAYAAWKLLTPTQKEAYRFHPLAKTKRLPPCHTFISLHMKGKL